MPYLPPLDTKDKKKLSIHDTFSQWTSPPTTILIYKTNGSHLIMIKKIENLSTLNRIRV